MKPTYKDCEPKKTGGFIELPPVGAYVAEIQAVRVVEQNDRDVIELFMEITEGEYANRFHEVYEDQKERFGDSAKYKGIFKLTPPVDGDEDWRKRTFEGNLWCVQQSNSGYAWDWDEKKWKDKAIGLVFGEVGTVIEGKEVVYTAVDHPEPVANIKSGDFREAKFKARNGYTGKGTTANNESTSASGNFMNIPDDLDDELPFN